MRSSRLCLGLLASALIGGCAILTPPIPNSAGLPKEALTLAYVLDQGCLPYMLGQKTEDEAMRPLRLTHHRPALTFVDPPGPPFWLGSYPGLSNVVVGRDSCSINMRGHDPEPYRAATRLVLRRRLGADVEQDTHSGYKAWLPGQITACRQGLRYTYYESPRGRIFSVDINRANCASDPMRSAD